VIAVAVVVAVVVWIVCGAFAYAVHLAFFRTMYPFPDTLRQDQSLAAFVGLFGPIGLLVALAISGFAEHGIRWR
jgi:hypothetical protein